jgi:hypothetical protein
LLDYVNSPGINENYFASLPTTQDWLVTSSSIIFSQPICIQPQTLSIAVGKETPTTVRCVRGPERTAPLDRYVVANVNNNSYFSKDQATNIYWNGDVALKQMFCTEFWLPLGWVPTIKALFSLVNYSSSPLINETMFTLPIPAILVSSTLVANNSNSAWSVDLLSGSVLQQVNGPNLNTFCAAVGVGNQ